MVKISTLFHRVDGFDSENESNISPDFLDLALEDHFLNELLGPLCYDPGDKIVQTLLKKI